ADFRSARAAGIARRGRRSGRSRQQPGVRDLGGPGRLRPQEHSHRAGARDRGWRARQDYGTASNVVQRGFLHGDKCPRPEFGEGATMDVRQTSEWHSGKLRILLEENKTRTGARIKVVGVGGGGGNAVNRMVQAGFPDVEFIVANTDQQALSNNAAPIKVQIGSELTKGLGAGADPNVGRAAALEDTDKL